MNTNFFGRNKVIIVGLLSAMALALSELLKTGESSTKVLVFSALLAAASFLANNLRGQWASIAGLVGTALTTYLTMESTGTISWAQIILQLVIGYLAIISAPAKSRAYEHHPTISKVKKDAERNIPTVAEP
jgi:hypothetical protein